MSSPARLAAYRTTTTAALAIVLEMTLGLRFMGSFRRR
jgi:hypothetical protein